MQQQWHLKGYGGEKGWLGSGIQKGRYYLVFRAFPPFALSKVSEELALQKGVFAELDTSSNWLHIPCKSETKESKAVCFAPGNDTHFRIRVERKIPLSLEIWQEEGESASLSGIRTALESIPDNAQSEYSKDLSHMLFGEAQLFMVKLSQRMPFLFNWPSWQLQDLQIGKVLPSQYLEIIRRAKVPGDSLPALRLEEKGKLRLTINLYFRGTLYLKAEELH